ncbi:protein phosphatase 1 regulatory subunit 42 isoform X1 [Lethenteron reissneri]|uniref:protein phosphatase 1 regulatory subunit 42 isoform X1 n=1 Tax=Lethenteron reissneri TaxID=7753 RepID=UPI002AB7C21B|nr:protein phosphatase 1 regulatory subunit 42 isoform X1 [Lethenteron reissneri]XP_061418568.1 protein phosphatase 1 regulatory subunit 42 isoform X1 [Lethenteron reissneri]XP_061418569.1 protein phosphatase 1 regulatory subunit 42 isoform X1 [Lethenteron reissneri]XP_061418570.1 protein phosphatase 1 regulatory subunit 42 isoform X1 [Lethenteron reissneri]XP_061418572.1 protein phosphatase 1 regulatory subunit 42 isoform X1 [Lethenteron reissneri]XP_061418573.1 protein phosphatase 1 regulato
MVRLTAELIGRSEQHVRRRRGEPLGLYLGRLTHLHLGEKDIEHVEDLSACRNLAVLYLYDNRLSRMPNLAFASHLTHLYLQNNALERMEGLTGLRHLSKLYLGGNAISVVEGVEMLSELTELHVENQHLPPGEKLLFDPRCLSTLAGSLCVLNVSGNGLEELQELTCLSHMMQFMACENQLTDLQDLADVLTCWPKLWRLELSGNPFCQKPKYRDRVIMMSASLDILDGKEIKESARQFLLNWKASREAKRKAHEQMSTFGETSEDLVVQTAGDTEARRRSMLLDLPQHYICPPLAGSVVRPRRVTAPPRSYSLPAIGNN